MRHDDKIAEEQKKFFADHVAQYWMLKGGPANGQVEMIRFQKPGTINYFIEFLFTNGTLFVRGDLGEATYCWHWDIGSIRQLSKVSRGYMKGKCQASEVGREFNEWYFGELEADVRAHFEHHECEDGVRQMLIENDEDPSPILEDDEAFAKAKERFIEQKVDEIHGGVGDHHEWIEFCRANGEEFFDSQDHWEYSYKMGNRTHSRMIIHHLALQLALKQLEDAKAFEEVTT
jgi:hypothetical protein